MPTTCPVAVFEAGFALVEVDSQAVEAYGADELWEALQNHVWILERDVDVVLVYHEGDVPCFYGDELLVREAERMNRAEIDWGATLTLDLDISQ